jgi:NADPH:quinone reductase-like Zn-dependent oxidoreductase
MRIVKRGGTLISVVEVLPPDLAQELGIRATMNATIPNRTHLQQIVNLIADGHAKPVIRQTLSLHDAPQAHELCETGHGRGRIVLHVID